MVGRLAEQGAIGLVTLVLAARLPVTAFAPIGGLLVANSVAITVADFGMGSELMRLARLGPIQSNARRLITATGAVTLVSGVPMVITSRGGGVAGVVGWSLLLWAIHGQLLLRQSAAMLHHRHRRLAGGQLVPSVGLVALVVVAGHGASAVAVTGAGLTLRYLAELALLSSVGPSFAAGGTVARPLPVFASQLVSYGSRNVDYALAAPLLGPAAFSQYVLAYRIGNAAFAPFGLLTNRLGLLGLVDGDDGDRPLRYQRYLRWLFGMGTAAAVATVAVAAAIPHLLGARWGQASGLTVVVAVTLPWRFLEGLVGPVAYSVGRHEAAVRLEVVRLVAVATAVTIGALSGLWTLAATMGSVTAVASWASHRYVARLAGWRTPRWLTPALIGSLLLVAAAAGYLHPSAAGQDPEPSAQAEPLTGLLR